MAVLAVWRSKRHDGAIKDIESKQSAQRDLLSKLQQQYTQQQQGGGGAAGGGKPPIKA